MALPPRAGARLVVLGNPEASPPFPAGASVLPYTNPTFDYIDTSVFYAPEPVWPPRQQPFSAYQDWYKEYPPSCVVKVSQGVDNTSNVILLASSGSAVVESTYPTDIVTSYNPGPPAYDPVPDPNGVSDDLTTSTMTGGLSVTPWPRWYDADPYDMAKASSYDYWQGGGFFPLKNHDYYFLPGGGNLFKVCSVDLTVENFESKVYNEQTGNYEYYPFTQATFHYKQTAKVKIPIDWEVCCWNDGAVIEGGITFSSIDVEAFPYSGSESDPDHGFAGMKATTGETITEESSTTWSVTISSSYTPVEIEIPTVANKITFITDFWISSVTPPT